MDFKTAIKAFQQTGDEAIVDQIISSVESEDFFAHTVSRRKYYDGSVTNRNENFNKNKQVKLDYAEPEKYIAYRIKAFVSKKVRFETRIIKPMGSTEYRKRCNNAYSFCYDKYDDYQLDYRDMYGDEYIDELIEEYGLEDCDDEEIEEFLEEYFNETFVSDNVDTIYDNIKKNQAKEQEIKQKEYIEEFKECLKYALQYVDTTRTEKEIVKYINRTMLSKWINNLISIQGYRRIQNKKARSVKMIKPFWWETMMIIFGEIYEVEYIRRSLSPKQFLLVQNIINIVEEDRKNDNIHNYKINEFGGVILNKRYIAERLSLEESNFKHQLKRLMNKLKNSKVNYKTIFKMTI